MPTARNARGVDIIAYSQDARRKVALQVKALSKHNPVPLGASLDKVMGDFWIVVCGLANSPSVFVLEPDEVRKLAHCGQKNGIVSYWLQPKSYKQDCFADQWGRLGNP